MTLATPADVRALIEKHPPMEYRKKTTWHRVSDRLAEAARGGDTANVPSHDGFDAGRRALPLS